MPCRIHKASCRSYVISPHVAPFPSIVADGIVDSKDGAESRVRRTQTRKHQQMWRGLATRSPDIPPATRLCVSELDSVWTENGLSRSNGLYNEIIHYAHRWSEITTAFHATWNFWCLSSDDAIHRDDVWVHRND
jgi:hypothetical protein